MDRARLTRIDGAVFADCLFLIGQAWVKRDTGDVQGAAEDLAAATALVPEGAVELILSMIEAGDLPEPSADPDQMDAWLERCRQAGAGDFKLTVSERPVAPPRPPPRAPALPPRQVESEEDFLKRLSKIRAEAEARQAARQGRPRPRP